jgi:ribosome biogenesis GTPase / thiamine phosphate phosphatase
MIKGIVTKSTGSFYAVCDPTGKVWRCRIVGKFRLEGATLTNPVAVGDEVHFDPETEEHGQIKKISPRKNYVARKSPHNRHKLHLLASNLDQAIVFATVVEPMIKPGFIDRFLLMTEPQDIPCAVVFNKADLYDDHALEIYEVLKDVYSSMGYEVVLTSTLTGQGLEQLSRLLFGKTTLVAGQSGVGKSSLINALVPGFNLRTGEISNHSGKGQHTTTFAEMFTLPDGTRIIDTPGIKALAFNNLTPELIAHNFRDLFELSNDCKFRSGCKHMEEPGCAVKKAVEEGRLHELRYTSYLQLMEEATDMNYWERHPE